MPSYKELIAQREQLDKQIKEAIALEKADGIAKAKLIIEQYNFAADLFSRKAGVKGAGGKVARWPQNIAILLQVKPGQVAVRLQGGLRAEIVAVI